MALLLPSPHRYNVTTRRTSTSMDPYLPVIKDTFKQHYQLIINHKYKPHPQAQRVQLWQLESAQSFIRSLDVNAEYWTKVAFECQSGIPHINRDHGQSAIAELLLHNRIEFYKLPQSSKNSIHDGNNKAYQFIKSPKLQLNDSDKITLNFTNKSDVHALMDRLTSDEEFWHNVLRENKIETSDSQTITAKEMVSSLIVSGALIAYQSPYTPAPPKSTNIIEDVDSPAPAPAPLGPHTSDEPAIIKKFKFLISS